MLGKLHRIVLKILPFRLLAICGLFMGLFSKKKSYSQYGEDLILLNFFRKIGVESGRYLDIGAFHPYWISNTKLLHDAGWSGVVVDIDPIKLWAFKVARGKRCQRVFGAIGPGSSVVGKSVTVYKFKRLLSEIDTLSEEQAQKYARDWGYTYFTSDVPYLGVNELLAQSGRIDLLNIDIEGLDSMIIGAIDFGIVRPAVVVFEDNDCWGGSRETIELLVRAGYERLFVSGGSVGYCLRELISQ